MMKKLLFIISIIVAGSVVSQTNYTAILFETKDLIKSKNYVEAHMSASDLLIENPVRYEGYYYSSLIYFNEKNLVKAQEFINKAKAFASEHEATVCNELEEKFGDLQNSLDYIEKANLESDQLQKAEFLTSAYKSYPPINSDAAIGALEILLPLKEYEKALVIVNQLKKSSDQELRIFGENLSRKIEGTSVMKNKRSYDAHYSKANRLFDNGDYDESLRYYQKAYNIKSSNSLKQRIDLNKEEIFWKKAYAKNYIEEYEKYLKKYPNGKYKSKANAKLKGGYPNVAKSAYKKGNESQMVSMYNKYLNRFGSDGTLSKMKGYLGDYYYQNGISQYKSKSTSTLKSSRANFNAYLRLYSSGERSNEVRRKLKMIDAKIFNNSMYASSFISYQGTTNAYIGLGLGRMTKKLGFQINARSNVDAFISAGDEVSVFGSSIQANSTYTYQGPKEYKTSIAEFMGGLNYRAFRPLWIYVNAGASWKRSLVKYEKFSQSSGNSVATGWGVNTNDSGWTYAIEFGTIIYYKRLYASIGVSTRAFDTWNTAFGIGITF